MMADCKKYMGKSFGLLVLRLALGSVFVYHGYLKLSNIAGTTGFFGQLGFPMPAFFAYLVGLVELVGGAMLILGLFTCIAAAVLAINMVVALLVAHTKMPYPAAELPIALLGGLAALGAVGGGSYSVMRHGCCKNHCTDSDSCCGTEKKDGCGCGGSCEGKCGGSCEGKEEACSCGGSGACGCKNKDMGGKK